MFYRSAGSARGSWQCKRLNIVCFTDQLALHDGLKGVWIGLNSRRNTNVYMWPDNTAVRDTFTTELIIFKIMFISRFVFIELYSLYLQ